MTATDNEVVPRISPLEMILALSTAIDIISPELDSHQKRTCYIASRLARQAGLHEDYSNIRNAALLHDVGAIALKDRLALLSFEDASPHQHGWLGAILLSCFAPFKSFASLVRYHHVQWNHGAGAYFDGEAVPLGSHLIYLADRVEVLAQGKSNIVHEAEAICAQIKEKAGAVFHPDFVAAFRQVCQQESFWLDLTSPQIDRILLQDDLATDTALSLVDIIPMARFFSLVIDSRSRFTATHSAGVAASAEALARLLGLGETDCLKVKVAGYLHDLGKVATPSEILEKREGLSLEERAVIRSHSYHTYEILSHVGGMQDIAAWASQHHERLDGSGYPYHLDGKRLELGSRILIVADVFTALSEDRPYRPGMDEPSVIGIMRDLVQKEQVDAGIVDTLITHFADIDRVRLQAQALERHDLAEFWENAYHITEAGASSVKSPADVGG